MSILITGATGYIGSHVCIELLSSGFDIVLIDNFSNSSEDVLDKIKSITNESFSFYRVDLLDIQDLRRVFNENNIQGVIHLAAYKAVGESVSNPLKYYFNNVYGLLNLLTVMEEYELRNMVFSSSATVYGKNISPLTENMTPSTNNPYGNTKLFCEQILKELHISNNDWSIVILRYFNPIGAHESGKIGERPLGIPNNIMPVIVQVATGKLQKLLIFGGDYDTKDGTCVRDYIHVVDLAKGHIKALEKTLNSKGLEIYNLGTGKGYSVLELVNVFENISNINIPYEIADRRAGDVDICFAEPSKANKELNWVAEKNLDEMCIDTWRWVCNSL
ncbi:UDP-glucose 4-epimerase GalE [Tissierella sp. Yu-01]|uniref:UDP-glucose 4-epimerase GalE n=1 Tax=Tissierella sp. Yu-01 TaxID=3035694 RepID=UPI00240DB624|nr:UDP-glucose 4-epimerase GalE [Tissierella sp. Yu-01]WFA10155.1 UDP-glucose 4-epimerase GalE [Tissierella sp. Yu-01]